MKKLNQKGWGLGPFVILVCIILCAVLIVASLILKMLGGRLDINWKDATEKTNYKEIEERVESAGELYQKKYYSDILQGDRYVVTVNRLKQETFLPNDFSCNGYVEIIKNQEIDYKGYIKCKNYQSKDYQDRLAQ